MANEYDQNYVYNKDIEFAPFRPLNEFITDTSRFELPKMNDPERWNKRIISNLLYFQSNYFVAFFVGFLITSAFNPESFALGFTILLMLVALAVLILSKDESISDMRKDHPYAFLAVILVISFLSISYLSSLLFASFAFMVPVILILIHASLRLRSIKNKVNEKLLEGIVRKTAMSSILRAFGIDARPF